MFWSVLYVLRFLGGSVLSVVVCFARFGAPRGVRVVRVGVFCAFRVSPGDLFCLFWCDLFVVPSRGFRFVSLGVFWQCWASPVGFVCSARFLAPRGVILPLCASFVSLGLPGGSILFVLV